MNLIGKKIWLQADNIFSHFFKFSVHLTIHIPARAIASIIVVSSVWCILFGSFSKLAWESINCFYRGKITTVTLILFYFLLKMIKARIMIFTKQDVCQQVPLPLLIGCFSGIL